MGECRYSCTCAHSWHSGSFIRGICKQSLCVPDMLRRAQSDRRDFLRDTAVVPGIKYIFHYLYIYDLYSSPNFVRVIKSRKMRWAGYVARMCEERGVYRVLLWKPEGKRPLGRHTRRWVDNIKMNLQEVGCGYMDWIGLAQDRDRWCTLVSAVMNLRVP